MEIRFQITLTTLFALSIPLILAHPSLSQQPHSSEFPQVQEMQGFIKNLVHTDFQYSHLNLVHNWQDSSIMQNKILDQLLQQGNPISLIDTAKLGVLTCNEILHQRSTSHELTIFFITSLTLLGHLLPKNLRSHLHFNIIFNWDPHLINDEQSLLWHAQLKDFKFKIELILINRNIILRSVCFYCNRGRPLMLTIDCLTCSSREAGAGPKNYSRTALFQDYTRNFHGRPVAGCAGHLVPTLHRFVTQPDGTIVPVAGIQVPILFMLERKLNFKIHMSLEKAFGKQEANGSFSGLLGRVQSGQAEVGLAAVITMDRLPLVEFANPNNIQVAVFSTARPSSGLRWQAVFQSLSSVAWAILLLICAGFILPLYIAISLVHNGRKLSALEASYQCFDFLYRTILEQGVEDRQLSYHPSGQILLVFWMFFSLILSNLYKSRLVSVMVSPLHEIVPNDFEELAVSSYEIYIQYDGGSLTNYIRATQSSTFRKISQRMILEKSIYKCIEFSLRPKTACVTYRDSLTAVGNKNFTDRNGNLLYRKAPGTAFFFPVGFIVRKNALIKDTIHKEISRIIDTGMARHAQDIEVKNSWAQGKQWARSGNGPKQVIEDSVDEKLTLEHLQGVFMMLLVSIIFACGLLAMEGSQHFHLTVQKNNLDEMKRQKLQAGWPPFPLIDFFSVPK